MKGVIYDLDGTIISTESLHESGWLYAGKRFNVPVTKEMLANQKGLTNEKASLMILPEDKRHLINEFKQAKQEYVNNNLKEIILFPHILETINQLLKQEYIVWICTSASKAFAEKVLDIVKSLDAIKNNVVYRELYSQGKPYPEALNLTIKKMGLTKADVCYVGDAYSDYMACVNANIQFIYFCPDVKNKDSRIPESVPAISSHNEIFKYL